MPLWNKNIKVFKLLFFDEALASPFFFRNMSLFLSLWFEVRHMLHSCEKKICIFEYVFLRWGTCLNPKTKFYVFELLFRWGTYSHLSRNLNFSLTYGLKWGTCLTLIEKSEFFYAYCLWWGTCLTLVKQNSMVLNWWFWGEAHASLLLKKSKYPFFKSMFFFGSFLVCGLLCYVG